LLLAALAAIESFFAHSFRYDTMLNVGKSDVEPLRDFLEQTQSGHCEYFATATVYCC
jgi:transglutaminase-like putative cysteine protease